MGLKPSANFAIIAMKETSKLEDFEERYPIAKKALSEDSYVDNTFITGKTIEGIRRKIEEINFVVSHGGVKYKEWNISKENFTQEAVSVHLPHTIGVDKEPPGVFWNVSKDEIYSSRLNISVGSKILGNTSRSDKNRLETLSWRRQYSPSLQSSSTHLSDH